MKKETVIAVSFGILLGVIVAVIMIISTQKKQNAKVIPVVQNNQITPIATKDAQIATLELSQPENETVTDTETVTIKGKSVKGSLVIVQSPVDSQSIINEKEEFSIDFKLALGENRINVSVYPKDANGAVQEKELIIYSLKEE